MILPTVNIETLEDYVTMENIDKFFNGDKFPDYVVDCVDNMDAKVAINTFCIKNKIRIISSCGAG